MGDVEGINQTKNLKRKVSGNLNLWADGGIEGSELKNMYLKKEYYVTPSIRMTRKEIILDTTGTGKY